MASAWIASANDVNAALVTALLLALAIAAAPEPGSAPDRWVLLVETDDSARPSSSLDDSVRTAARFRVGVRFLSPEEAFVEGGLEAESGLSSCGNDTSCLASRLRHIRADYALLLVVRRVAQENLIALRVVRTGTGDVLHRGLTQTKTRDQIAAATSAITTAAFDALGYARGGELVATAKPNNAELIVADGVTDRPISAGRPMLLPAGSYVVRARLADFEDATAQVRIDDGATQTVELLLTPRPSITDNAWFWVGLGVAATALGVAIGVAATGSDRCFCAAADPEACGSCP